MSISLGFIEDDKFDLAFCLWGKYNLHSLGTCNGMHAIFKTIYLKPAAKCYVSVGLVPSSKMGVLQLESVIFVDP